MSTETNKVLIRRFFETLNMNDLATLPSFWARDEVNHGRYSESDQRQERPPVGLEGLSRVFQSLHKAFPDRRWHIDDLVAEGDRVVCRLTVSGTHQGTPEVPVEGGPLLQAILPSGKHYTIQHVHVFRLSNGKIAEHWAARDDLGLLQQLGAFQKPQPA